MAAGVTSRLREIGDIVEVLRGLGGGKPGGVNLRALFGNAPLSFFAVILPVATERTPNDLSAVGIRVVPRFRNLEIFGASAKKGANGKRLAHTAAARRPAITKTLCLKIAHYQRSKESTRTNRLCRDHPTASRRRSRPAPKSPRRQNGHPLRDVGPRCRSRNRRGRRPARLLRYLFPWIALFQNVTSTR